MRRHRIQRDEGSTTGVVVAMKEIVAEAFDKHTFRRQEQPAGSRDAAKRVFHMPRWSRWIGGPTSFMWDLVLLMRLSFVIDCFSSIFHAEIRTVRGGSS